MAGSIDGLFHDPRGEQLPVGHDAQEVGQDAEPVAPLDQPQDFAEATSFQVRDELEDLVRRDLLGPWDGPSERFHPRAMGPRERYLVGMLGPRHTPSSVTDEAGEVQDNDTGVEGDASDAELPDVVSPQALGKLWASSMGLSFCVDAAIDAVSVRAAWGRYDKHDEEDENGKKIRPWARKQEDHEKEVRLDAEPSYKIPLTMDDPEAPGVLLSVGVRQRDGKRIVELALVNAQAEPPSNKDTAWLFQPELTVTALDGAKPVFLPVDDPLDDREIAEDDPEELHLRLLYRNERRYAAGRNVAVHADIEPGERRAHRLVTTWLPVYDVPATVAPTGPGTPLEHVELSMDALAEATPEQLKAGLRPLVDGYEKWLDQCEAEIPGLPATLRETAERAVADARRAASRIAAGVALLTDPSTPRHAEALQAFHFANETMALQRRNTQIGALREEGLGYAEAEQKVAERGAKAASWRPFQLAFVLLNLPSLTDPGHPERAADHTALVDLLFFPTGGGKTEAYLGLIAYTLGIRRLQGLLGSGEDARDGLAGVAVLMRYTLRLLTAQQFQRAAALICAAEVLRQRDPQMWGTERFRIGLWVGAGVSPNWFEDAKEQVVEARDAGKGNRANVLQTLACPWCGEGLRAERDLWIDEDRRRVLLYCHRGEGEDACPFSKRKANGEGLPILTVDEEIYRYAPSLVIATVDKLAQLPWKGYAGILFGRMRSHCDRHGFRHDDLDDRIGCAGKHNKKGALPAITAQPVVRLRPPDLIIQDELHLISGALGTTVGLFEAAVAELTSWPFGEHRTGPKIVASTATTKRSRQQVLGVFGRDLAVFPPQVIDASDTFFSEQKPVTPETPGRRYLGVCAHGVRLKSAEIRLAEILLLAGQTLFDKYGAPADPYMTLVGYFNATRELAGMRRYLDDDVTTRVRRHGRAKGLSDRVIGNSLLVIQELTSRISSGDISDVLKRLEHGFDPEIDTHARRSEAAAEMRRIMKARKESRSAEKAPAPHPLAERFYDRQRAGLTPVDVVLATSMLQVGVDVPRFGLMVMTGQPKNTAEYIQASSRVGREATKPGLVVTLYNWSRPRDLAHYEDFEHYHATFYRQVEALSVTPYTRRALDRGTTATLVAAVRQAVEEYSRNRDAYDVDLEGPIVQEVIDRMLVRAEAVAHERGRDYLAERVKRVTDLWETQKNQGSTRLGYQDGTWNKQVIRGLLEPAGNGRWGDLTAGMSMRETENEINLLLPGGDALFKPVYNEPAWSFGPPVETEDDDAPAGDELGETALNGKGA
ncbi:helicase [Actinomadura logoneensis]|uniref:Helicase n=1 Tax=Actinomadura logoneensis TaxID=2293572 RepID=A0A372JHQ6_9ACTN|nr:DISARM system helicase DrmA [Actinomadura logoneensis]RFU39429.1 helicase [Actinomadura logoneensis]